MAKRLRSLGDLRSAAQDDTNASSRCDEDSLALVAPAHN